MSNRRLVEIRCGFAELAQREADMAGARLADSDRRTETQLEILAEVQALADPDTTRAAKERAHTLFKAAVIAARDHAGVESAAHVWLVEINRINDQLRKARVRLRRERETADSLIAERERLTSTAEAAREMAEAARQACLEAQGVLAIAGSADEAADVAAETTASGVAMQPSADSASDMAEVTMAAMPAPAAAEMAVSSSEVLVAGSWAPDGSGDGARTSSETLVGASASTVEAVRLDLRARPSQMIIRLLNRDSLTLNWLVERLAGTSVNARSAWKQHLSGLVDAAIAAAIDDACFEFPPGNPFWDLFHADQAMEIARGLAALGFRYDGFGSFVDERIPDQRDLALAIGSAGLYPVRVRYWPRAGEAAHLFRDVRVATDVFLVSKAPELSLGEMVFALGRRAELLADLWNDWDRVRPLLLANPEL